ncbi:MAG: ABC transporter permease [bacterium]|nr:ABC transporter permease [bacterium]
MQLSTPRIAWRNLGRNTKRTLLAVGAIALGQFTLVFVNSLTAASFHQMIQTITGPLVGHAQVHHPEWREERAIDLYLEDVASIRSEIESLPEVHAASPRIYSAALAASGELTDEPAEAHPSMLVGIDPAIATRRGGLLEGLAADQLPGDRAVVVGRILANRLGVEEGELLAVIGQDADGFPVSDLFTIRAIVNSSVDLVKTMGVVLALPDAEELLAMPGRAHEIIIQGEEGCDVNALAGKVAALPGLGEAEVLSWKQALPEFVRIIDMKGYIDLVFLGIVFIAAAAGIANTTMMSTFERRHEFGMLLAVGSRPSRIVGMVLIESVVLGFIGVLIGSILGSALVLVTAHTGIDYAAMSGSSAEDIAFAGVNFSFILYPVFEWKYVFMGLVAVTLTSVLASAWPASLAARLEPVEAMRS